MKRETRRWLEASAGCDHVRYNCKEADCAGTLASNAIDSDARQRAEIRGLKKRLETARCRFAAMGMQAFVDECNLKKPLKETKR